MRFGYIVVPHSQILFVSEFSFLVSSVQHSACAVSQIFPEILYRMEVSVHSIVIAMPSDYRRQYLHRFFKRFRKPCFHPYFCRLLLRFQLLLARPHSQSVFACSCSCVVEGKTKKIKIFLCSFESAYWQYSCLFLCYFKPEFFKSRLQCCITLCASFSYWNNIRKSSAYLT